MDMETNPQDRGLISRIGPVEVDWPRSIGYFGGVTLATALGIIEPPIAIFIAAVPFFRAFIRPSAPRPVRFTGEVLAGAAIPVGGGGRAAIEPAPQETAPQVSGPLSILIEARRLANQAEGKNR